MRTTRPAAVLCGAATSVLLLAAPASAHVTAHGSEATRGGHDAEITFRVPNEKASATTTTVVVVLPTDTPLAGVMASPKPGWTVTAHEVTLTKAIPTDDGAITSVVDRLTWTATGGGTPAGQYDDFAVAVGQLPDADELVFKALQTYSDGKTVSWIQQSAPGSTEEPDFPAPVLSLTTAAGGHGDPVATPEPTVSATATAVLPAASQSDDGTAEALGAAGLGVAALAAVLAGGAFVRAGRARS